MRKRQLYLVHRWFGIGVGWLFVVYLVTGLVMMYSWYPDIPEHERLAALRPLAPEKVRLSLAQVARKVSAPLTEARLAMLGERPLWRLKPKGEPWASFWADTGQPLSLYDPQEVVELVSGEGPEGVWAGLTSKGDEWSGRKSLDDFRPLHKVLLPDLAGTEVYVSARTGELVQRSTAAQRFWAWGGTLVHLANPVAVLRGAPQVRYGWLVGVAAVGTLLALTGLIIGVMRFKRGGYRLGSSPYQGWHRFHHLAGLIFGGFLFLWMASGLYYMLHNHSPYPLPQQVEAAAGGRLAPERASRVPRLPEGTREAVWVQVLGRPYLCCYRSFNESVLLPLDAPAEPQERLDEPTLRELTARVMPGVAQSDARLLEHEDAYYYSRHTFRLRRLPIWRVAFSDPERIVLYINPHSGQLEYMLTQSDRVFRWLFRAVHSFDLPFLLNARPWWDIALWVTCLGGLGVTIAGLLIGKRRLWAKRRARD